ncbi:DUF768 domain-containing protein [Mesorhizobium sp. LjNodule214]|uniref:DUF768 domain-containing protein n=1 Tax=Mesorhizobium sp. LjNodule214 TaxID=3342252 RepID=UPI003F4F9C12
MSTRGIDFIHLWITNNVPEAGGADVISVSEMTHKLFADAEALGIDSFEIEEDADSAYEDNPRRDRAPRRRLG